MLYIHQALFGYSDGHHLIKSSFPLSSNSIKLLEPLSDLSGTEFQANFDGYITGCPIAEDNLYAVSKTWYAYEMDRPGCVWTHTLLLNLEEIPYNINIDNLFSRPTNFSDEIFQQYEQPIEIKPNYTTSKYNHLSKDENVVQYISLILKAFLDSNKPVLIAAENCKYYNLAFEYLLTKFHNSFFENISFCSGSFSIRNINKKILDIQILPITLFKRKFRDSSDVSIVLENDLLKVQLHWINLIIQEYILDIDVGFNNFINFFGIKFRNKKYIKLFSQIYILALYSKDFDIKIIVNSITSIITDDQLNNIVSKLLSVLLDYSFNEKYSVYQCQIKLLQDFSTIDNNNISVDEAVLEKTLYAIFNFQTNKLTSLFKYLISNKINSIGEQIIFSLAKMVKPAQLSIITGNNYLGADVLIRYNDNLLLCEDLWKQPLINQVELLSYAKLDTSSTILLLKVIYENSKQDISKDLFLIFGSISLKTFLMWGNNHKNKYQIDLWIKICRYDIPLTLQILISISDQSLIINVLNTILECDLNNIFIDNTILLLLNKNLGNKTNNNDILDAFSQIAVISVLKDQLTYEYEFKYWVLSRVHTILEKNKMSYVVWENMSKLLPENMWYNSWDKCKRLRKAAKKLGVNLEKEES